jgi:DNA (cytosine-5)-methyltransferase 1
MRPKLLDLFCGAGGCSVGYHRAGFDVVGVDIEDHPDYPYALIVADAMEILADADYLRQFDAIHASPPCQHYSVAAEIHVGSRANHPDLLPGVRQLLRANGGPYVIENVPGAPMDHPVLICGWAMGYQHLPRHRLFESNLLVMSPGCACPFGDSVSVFGHSGEDRRKIHDGRRTHMPIAEVRKLMGCEWMTKRDDISEAIPPGYTEYIGSQLIDQLALGAIPLTTPGPCGILTPK